MRRMAVVLLMVCAVTLGISDPARSQNGPFEDPLGYSAPLHSWGGLYVGAHLGGTWADTTATDRAGYTVLGDYWSAAPSGVVAGVQAGYNWRLGALLYGVEGDMGDLGLGGGAASGYVPFSFDTSTRTDSDFYLTLRGRLGITANQWLLYATGGYIGVDTRVSVIDACTSAPCSSLSINASDSSFRSGWTLGGGIETVLSGAWTAKIEYLYYDIGSRTVTGYAGSGAGPYSWKLDTDGQLVRGGINYSFGATN